ncbi:Hypothetical protein CINCED_3A022598 [Cinara cedri]|uniref:HTH CENPB-type domain-containing protein n=1 Tax=Cinara cedri TaxID=506608 RepID=A0A5E4NS99_9HEMI|nr:Hypothetical protein CINCED_3A022598 [Cinara cedri]
MYILSLLTYGTIMPRNYQRKRCKKWTIQDIKNAINDHNINKKSCIVLEKEYGIPVATLRRYLKRKVEDYPVNGGRFKNIFSHEQLLQLKVYLTEIDRQSQVGLKKVEYQKLIYDFAVNNNIPHRFSNITKLAGKDWMMNFMKKYNFSLKKPKATIIRQISSPCVLTEEDKKQMRKNIILHRRKVLSFLENVYDTDLKEKVELDQSELLKVDMFFKSNGQEPIPENIKVKDEFQVKKELDYINNYES